jgi:hypothetical protein
MEIRAAPILMGDDFAEDGHIFSLQIRISSLNVRRYQADESMNGL